MKSSSLFTAVGVLAATVTAAQAAEFSMNQATGTFTPSFRGGANTTYFGWGSGSFDGATNNELIDSPAPTLPAGGPFPSGVNLVQNHTADILVNANNIYTLFSTLDLTLTAPTDGIAGTGFTTIIIQGRNANGLYDAVPVFGTVAGVTPDVLVSADANGIGQFWAKYELPGNAVNYAIPITGGNHISINQLIVDTQWSGTGYSPDIAVVPEPASLGLLALGSLALKRRRRSV